MSLTSLLDALEAFAEKEAQVFNARVHQQAASDLQQAVAAVKAEAATIDAPPAPPAPPAAAPATPAA